MSKVTVKFTVAKAGFEVGDTKSVYQKLAAELVAKGFAEYESLSGEEKPVKRGKKA